MKKNSVKRVYQHKLTAQHEPPTATQINAPYTHPTARYCSVRVPVLFPFIHTRYVPPSCLLNALQAPHGNHVYRIRPAFRSAQKDKHPIGHPEASLHCIRRSQAKHPAVASASTHSPGSQLICNLYEHGISSIQWRAMAITRERSGSLGCDVTGCRHLGVAYLGPPGFQLLRACTLCDSKSPCNRGEGILTLLMPHHARSPRECGMQVTQVTKFHSWQD